MSTPSDKTLRLERTKLNPQGPKGRNTTLIIAVVAGAAAALLAFILLRKPATPTNTAVAVVAPAPNPYIVVASQDIAARTVITSDMVKIDNKTKKEQLTGQEAAAPVDVVGKVATVPISSGAPILASAVVVKDAGMGLAYTIPANMRAMAIALDPVSSVAGFLKPGDHVDVISTFDAGRGQSLTKTVLQDVVLLATGSQAMQSYSAGSGGVLNTGANPATSDGTAAKSQDIPNATVVVSPQDAQKLMLAATKGKLMLTLRSAGDTTRPEVPSVRLSAVSGIPPDTGGAPAVRQIVSPPPVVQHVDPLPTPVPPVQTVMPIPTITVIRGSDARSVSVGQ